MRTSRFQLPIRNSYRRSLRYQLNEILGNWRSTKKSRTPDLPDSPRLGWREQTQGKSNWTRWRHFQDDWGEKLEDMKTVILLVLTQKSFVFEEREFCFPIIDINAFWFEFRNGEVQQPGEMQYDVPMRNSTGKSRMEDAKKFQCSALTHL